MERSYVINLSAHVSLGFEFVQRFESESQFTGIGNLLNMVLHGGINYLNKQGQGKF